jgi:hypothetical protein
VTTTCTETDEHTKRATTRKEPIAAQRNSTLALFIVHDRNYNMSSNYKRHSFELLKTLYPRLSVRAIERTFKIEYDYRFTDAFNTLHAIHATIPIGTKSETENVRARILQEAPFLESVDQIVLKHKRASSNRLPRIEQLDHGLVQEMSHIPHSIMKKEKRTSFLFLIKDVPRKRMTMITPSSTMVKLSSMDAAWMIFWLRKWSTAAALVVTTFAKHVFNVISTSSFMARISLASLA